jgi:hypothetical protein
MNCAAQAITMSTTTTQLPLPWASGIPLSPATPTTNRMVSTELAPDNEQGASGDTTNNNSGIDVPFYVMPAVTLTARAQEDSTPSTKLVVPTLTTPIVPASIGDIFVINNNSTKDVPPAMEEVLWSDQVPGHSISVDFRRPYD